MKETITFALTHLQPIVDLLRKMSSLTERIYQTLQVQISLLFKSINEYLGIFFERGLISRLMNRNRTNMVSPNYPTISHFLCYFPPVDDKAIKMARQRHATVLVKSSCCSIHHHSSCWVHPRIGTTKPLSSVCLLEF